MSMALMRAYTSPAIQEYIEAEKHAREVAALCGVDADLMIAEAEGLAKATTFSNAEALWYVADRLKRERGEAGEIETDNQDFSAGGTSAAALGDAVENLAKTWESISITATVAFDRIKELFSLIELGGAINCAKVLEPAMADRYIHTKKKRTRKKYEKRIRAWFREVVLKCLD
jgi:hypothetical protein